MDKFYPIIFMALIFLSLWFLVIRPEQKRKKTYNSMLSELKVNDQIMTRGGVLAKIVKIEEDSMLIETAEKTRLKIVKDAVAKRAPKK